jgi:hypothetical protein
MIEVTDEAKQVLENKIISKAGETSILLRLVPKAEGRLTLVPDQEKQGDQVISRGDKKVLLVGKELSDVLNGLTLKVKEKEDGVKVLTFR